jgi:F-type H+-transporting ATPase subunit b
MSLFYCCPTKANAVDCRALSWIVVVSIFWASASLFGFAQEQKAAEAAVPHAEKSGVAAQPDVGHAAPATHAEPGIAHAAGEHGSGHDESDLSHGNATSNLTSLVDPRFDTSIYSFIVFLLLLAVLYKFAWGPIATALDRRENTIARQIEEAKLASEKGEQLLRQYEARLAAATDEARQIVAGARKDAELAKDRIVAEAREAAQRERDRAVSDITVAKNQALDQIAQKSVQTAVSLASNILRREVKPQEHETIIGEAINQFSKMN